MTQWLKAISLLSYEDAEWAATTALIDTHDRFIS